jgi:hypothetical protein
MLIGLKCFDQRRLVNDNCFPVGSLNLPALAIHHLACGQLGIRQQDGEIVGEKLPGQTITVTKVLKAFAIWAPFAGLMSAASRDATRFQPARPCAS